MSKCNTQQLLQDGSCFLCLDAGIRQVLELQLLCEILNNGIGGGGSGVTGDGTLFPATSQTTLTLNSQSANLIFAGPGSGAAAAPTFRAMVTSDLGTTLTPQFARIGLGLAADANILLVAKRASAGVGVNVEIANFDVTTSNPFIVVGAASLQAGGQLIYDRANGTFSMNMFGVAGIRVDNSADVTVPTGNMNVTTGVFTCQGSSGVSGPFTGANTVTVVGGIVTNIA